MTNQTARGGKKGEPGWTSLFDLTGMPHEPDTCHPEYVRYFLNLEQTATAAAKRAQKPAKCWRALMGQVMTTASAWQIVVEKLEVRQGRLQTHTPTDGQTHGNGVDLNECDCMSCLWSDASRFSARTRVLIGHINYAFVRMEDKLQDAYAREDDLLEENAELRELLANVSAEQLIKLEDNTKVDDGTAPKAGSPKKKKKARSKKTKKEIVKPDEIKLVPVFGAAPPSTGGAFAVLDDSGDERFHPTEREVRALGPVGSAPIPSHALNPLAASMQWTKFDGTDLLACMKSLSLAKPPGLC